MKWVIWQTLEFVLIISSVKSSNPSLLILTRKDKKTVAEQRYKVFCSCSFFISEIHSSDFYYIRSFISKMCTRIDPLVQLDFQAPQIQKQLIFAVPWCPQQINLFLRLATQRNSIGTWEDKEQKKRERAKEGHTIITRDNLGLLDIILKPWFLSENLSLQ